MSLDLLCRICGLKQQNPPWGKKGDQPSFAICPCCGGEFGYDDATVEAVVTARKQWMSEGCEWFLSELRPARWNVQTQMKDLDGSPWDPKVIG